MNNFDTVNDLIGVQALNQILLMATYYNDNLIHENLTNSLIWKLQQADNLRNFSIGDIKKFLRCISRINHFEYGETKDFLIRSSRNSAL